MTYLWAELWRRNRVLTAVGALHAVLLVVAVFLSLLDTRLITGVNAWLKPAKFMGSIAIYLWTLAWFVGYLKDSRWGVRLVAWGASGAMLVESFCLWIQAARGTSSHFNIATPFDGSIFGLMGTMIAINTASAALLLLLFFWHRTGLSPTYYWSICLGLGLFLAGSAEGTVMIGNMAHTVGAPDGGPGLPLLDWSTVAGDLRIAHLLGLHALQIIPLAGFQISRAPYSQKIRLGLLLAVTVAYGALMWLLFQQALAGRPLLG